MKLHNFSHVKVPLDTVVYKAMSGDSLFHVGVQRFDQLRLTSSEVYHRLAWLSQRMIESELTLEELDEEETLDQLFFQSELRNVAGTYVLTGLEGKGNAVFDELKDSIRPRMLFKLERFGEFDSYQVSANGHIYELSRDDYVHRLKILGEHLNDVLTNLVAANVRPCDVSNGMARFLSDRLKQYALSFYAVYFGFPNAHVTFCDDSGKPFLYDSGAYPTFLVRDAIPTLEKATTCQRALTEFDRDVHDLCYPLLKSA